MTKMQPRFHRGGRFAKDRLVIGTDAGAVTCPAHVTVAIQAAKAGGRHSNIRDRRGTVLGCPVHDRGGRAQNQDRPL